MGRSKSNWRVALLLAGGVVLVAAAILIAERVSPSRPQTVEAAGHRPKLTRPGDRRIEIDAGLLDRSAFDFDERRSVASVDAFYRCLQTGIEDAFGAASEPLPAGRMRRRIEIGSRIERLRDACEKGTDLFFNEK